jgi:EAL domain-containing protein (putative c-di-GMP-specific phosphodiesterase class I)
VSVNLSLKSLTDPGLAERITGLVQKQDLDPRRMVLEVTESAAMTDVGRALENLTRLRMKGFGLSIDDYGTGYSSMQQLSRIPFTELKIDQSFVLSALEKESSKVILASSLDMARKLKLHSVAEGVETRAHWNLLKSLGCDIAQGYFVAKPMDAHTFSEWSLKWTPPE